MERIDEIVATLLKAGNEVERYLHEDGPLTPLQHQTIVTTLMGLQALLQSWTRKHRPEDTPQACFRSHARDRNRDGDGGSLARFTVDADPAVKRTHPFLHARQS